MALTRLNLYHSVEWGEVSDRPFKTASSRSFRGARDPRFGGRDECRDALVERPPAVLDWERLARSAMHPTQLAVLHALMDGEASPHALARRLDQPLGSVAYHVRRLHSVGLVVLVHTEARRGATEHFYVLTDGLLAVAGYRGRPSHRSSDDG